MASNLLQRPRARVEARAALIEVMPAKRWPGVEAKSIDPVKLAQLGMILEGIPITSAALSKYLDGIRELAAADDDGPWVMLVPATLTEKLASLPEQQLPSVAPRWHAIEEFRLDHWQKSDVADLLKELHQLAKRARASKKPMLLRMSL